MNLPLYLLETQLLHRSNQIQIERGTWPTVASLTQLMFTVVVLDVDVIPSIPLLDTSCNTGYQRHLLSRRWVRSLLCVTKPPSFLRLYNPEVVQRLAP